MPNSVKGSQPSASPRCRHTSQAAIAIPMYKVVQTGPNSQFGGFHEGFSRVAYQSRTDRLVTTAPTPAQPRQMTRNIAKSIHWKPVDGCCSFVCMGGFPAPLAMPRNIAQKH